MSKSVKEHVHCVFNEELWIPTLNPALMKHVQLMLTIKRPAAEILLGTIYLDYQKARLSPSQATSPRWYYFYGAPLICIDSPLALRVPWDQPVARMNLDPSCASTYRGRILIGLNDFQVPDNANVSESTRTTSIRPVTRDELPPEKKYVLRMWVLAGSDLPGKMVGLNMTSFRKAVKLRVVASIGPLSVATAFAEPSSGSENRRAKNEYRWGEALELGAPFPSELADRWSTSQVQQLVQEYDQCIAEYEAFKQQVPALTLQLHSLELAKILDGNGELDAETLPTRQDEQHRTGKRQPHFEILAKLARQQAAARKRLLLALQDAQVPDVFVYLQDDDENVLCFARFAPETLLVRRFAPVPQWHELRREDALGLIGSNAFPGSLQIALGFGPEEMDEESKSAWDPSTLTTRFPRKPIENETHQRCSVFVNIYQAHCLPAADRNGFSDPVAHVKLQGVVQSTKTLHRTLNPVWNERLRFEDVLLPRDPQLYPRLLIDIFDFDELTANDFLGSCRVDLPTPSSDPVPKWYALDQTRLQLKNGASHLLTSSSSSLLLSVEVAPEESAPAGNAVMQNVRPDSQGSCLLQVLVLGLRGLSGVGPFSTSATCVKFDLGHQSGESSHRYSTQKSNRPSPRNPNFGDLVEIPFELPVDLVFLPRLQVLVEDSRLGGLATAVLGSSSIPILPAVLEMMERERDTNASASQTQDCEKDNERAPDLVNGQTSSSSSSSPPLLGSKPPTLDPWPNHDPLPLPEFMKGRGSVSEELELLPELQPPPFQSFPIFTGSAVGSSFFGLNSSINRMRKVGELKAAIRVIWTKDRNNASKTEAEEGIFHPTMIEKLAIPRPVQVRLYVLKCFALTPTDIGRDHTQSCDPYLQVALGDKTISCRSNYKPKTTEPGFYQRFEFHTAFPGPSQLEIKVYDHDLFRFSDDLVGSTTIDLEDRWFSRHWSTLFSQSSISETRSSLEIGLDDDDDDDDDDGVETSSCRPTYLRKPVEYRSLKKVACSVDQGKLECWVDIMDHETAQRYPPVDIAPPEGSKYELRVVVWSATVFADKHPRRDLYVRASFGKSSEKRPLLQMLNVEHKEWKSTDIHWRAKNGKACWNYRIKFPHVSLPCAEKDSRLMIQLWDKDVGLDRCLGERQVNLNQFLKRAYIGRDDAVHLFDDREREQGRGQSQTQQAMELVSTLVPWAGQVQQPPNSGVVRMRSLGSSATEPPSCDVRVSVELVRQDLADTFLKNASGRREPNQYPTLSKPVGRLQLSLLYNPCALAREIIGPEACTRIYCFLVLILVVLLFILILPDVGGITAFVANTGWVGAVIIAIVLFLLVSLCCYYTSAAQLCLADMCGTCCCCCRRHSDSDELEPFADIEANRQALLD